MEAICSVWTCARTGADTLLVWRIWVIFMNLMLIACDGERGLGEDHSIEIYNQGGLVFILESSLNQKKQRQFSFKMG